MHLLSRPIIIKSAVYRTKKPLRYKSQPDQIDLHIVNLIVLLSPSMSQQNPVKLKADPHT